MLNIRQKNFTKYKKKISGHKYDGFLLICDKDRRTARTMNT